MKRLVAISMVLLLLSVGASAEYKAGFEYLKNKQYKKALAEFQADVEVYGSYWYVPAYMSAVCYYKMKDYGSAMEMLRQAESATEKSQTKILDISKIKTLEAQILVSQGKYHDAITIADKYISQSPADIQAALYYVKGFAENRIGQHSKAVNDLLQAKALNPEDANALYQLGFAYVKNNNMDGAISALEESAKLNPRDQVTLKLLTDVCLNRARSLSGNSKVRLYTKAIDWCQTGLRYHKNDSDLMLNLGNGYLGAKQYVAAIGIFEQMRNKSPNDTDVLFGLGSSYMGTKQFDKALPILLKVKSHMKDTAVIYNYIGTAQLSLGKAANDLNQCRTALATFQEGARRFSDNRSLKGKVSEANKIVQTFEKNREIEAQNREADLANMRKLKERIMQLRERMRNAEEIKRKQGIYPANYESDKKELEQTLAQYQKLYGPLK